MSDNESVPRRSNAREQVRRDARIVADRARGLTWPTIAERHGLSERRCRTIWKTRVSGLDDLGERDLVATLRDAIANLDAVIEDCALLAERTANDSVRLGAIKARMAAMSEKLGLLQRCGLLPDFGLWRYEIDVRLVSRTILDVFDEHGIEGDVRHEIAERLSAQSARNGAKTFTQ